VLGKLGLRLERAKGPREFLSCSAPMAGWNRLSALRLQGAVVYLHPENLVLQGMQKAVHGEGREHL